MKSAGGLGAALSGTAVLTVLLLLIVKKGPMGGLMVILGVAILLFVVTALSVLFGKRKKDG